MTGQIRLTIAAAVATTLASLSLTPVLVSGPWAGPVFAVILVVAVTASTMRYLHAPRWSVVAVPTASLVLLFTLMFAHGVATLGILPGPAVWRSLEATVRSGVDVLWAQAPPVTATRGVTLIMASAVAVVAVAVDALGVTFRHAAFAGLPLLLLYLIPSAVIPGGAPWLLFALTATGWLILLVADSRDSLRRWGRTLSMRQMANGSSPVDVALGSSSRRIGAVAVVTAIVVPLAVPFLSDGVFGRGSGDGAQGTSGGSIGQTGGLDPVAALRRDLTLPADGPVFSYTTNDDSPAYFRLATLTTYADSKWTPGIANPVLVPIGQTQFTLANSVVPSPANLGAQKVVTNIKVEPTYNDQRLPLPLTATGVSNAGDNWEYDAVTGDVVGVDPSRTTAGLNYTVASADLAPTPRQLRASTSQGSSTGHGAALGADAGALTAVPDQTRQELQPYLDALGSHPTDFDQALAIQNWLSTRFRYSLAPAASPTTTDDLVQFLDAKSGYCQQFAAVMALMARMSGIPARVAVGFTPGTPVGHGSDKRWQVTWHDAHAWPELWFPQIGWMRFEPTPPGQGGLGAGLPPYANPKTVLSSGGHAGDHVPKPPHGAIDPNANLAGAGRGGVGAPSTPVSSQPFNWTPWVLLAVAVTALLLLMPALTRRRVRAQRRRETDPRRAVEAAWAEVIDTATDLDLEPLDVESPRDLAARLRREGGITSAVVPAMTRLARAVERNRYAKAPGTCDDPWGDARSVCDALISFAGQRRARVATWWPASGREHLRRRWRAATDRVDLVQDRAAARARRRPGTLHA
jgi:transglutaminase-like putative cysteine protease